MASWCSKCDINYPPGHHTTTTTTTRSLDHWHEERWQLFSWHFLFSFFPILSMQLKWSEQEMVFPIFFFEPVRNCSLSFLIFSPQQRFHLLLQRQPFFCFKAAGGSDERQVWKASNRRFFQSLLPFCDLLRSTQCSAHSQKKKNLTQIRNNQQMRLIRPRFLPNLKSQCLLSLPFGHIVCKNKAPEICQYCGHTLFPRTRPFSFLTFTERITYQIVGTTSSRSACSTADAATLSAAL